MKPILKVIVPDKDAEATVNALFEDLYNRVVPNETLNKLIREGMLDRPHIDSSSTGTEFDRAYIYVHCMPVDGAQLYSWAFRWVSGTRWTEYFTSTNENKLVPLFWDTDYEVKVRAFGVLMIASDWSYTIMVRTAAAPSPSPVTGLTATSMFKYIFLEWPNSDFPSFYCYEVWRADVNDRSTATKIGEAFVTVFSDYISTYGVTRYYWIRARNIYGGYGAWYPESATGGVAGSPIQIASTDLADLSVITAKLEESAVITSKLANLAVDNSKLAALAVDAAKLATGLNSRIDWIDTEEFVFDPNLIDPNIVSGLDGAFSGLSAVQSSQYGDISNLFATTSSHATYISALQTEIGSLTTTAWSATSSYAVDNYVIYSGIIYRCIQAYTYPPAKTPGVDTDYWEESSALSTIVSEAAEAIVGPIALISSPAGRIVENGVVVEDVGDIYGVDVKVSLAGIRIDGTEANINLHAVTLSNLDGRMSAAETDIDAGEAGTWACISNKVLIASYNTDQKVGGVLRVATAETNITSLQTADQTLQSNINAKVAISTYDPKMASLDGSISAHGSSIATAETNIGVLQTASGNIQAQYTVKLNVGHTRVAGFGLMLAEGVPSEFIILSDKFQVVNPSNTMEPRVVFTVGNIGGVSAVGINGDLIIDGTISARTIVAGAIETAKLAALAVSADKIAAGAIIAEKIGAGAVIAGKIAANAITASGAEIADATITSAKIGSAAVGAAAIAALAVGTAHIADAAIQSAKIGDLQVLTAKIVDGAITEAKIGNLAVTSAKIAALAVDSAKIADLAVGSAKIGNLEVGTTKVAGDAITYAKRQIMYNGSNNFGSWSLEGNWYVYTVIHNLGRRVTVQMALTNCMFGNILNDRTYGLAVNGINSFKMQANHPNYTYFDASWDYW